jgi:hypothetical protein
MFDMRCRENGIEHRLTKIKHPWTNGQVERMNRTIKEDEAAKSTHWIDPPNGKGFRSADHDQLRRHLANVFDAYNFRRRAKTLRRLTPYECIVKCWTSEPERFELDPTHHMPGLNTKWDLATSGKTKGVWTILFGRTGFGQVGMA